MGTTGVGIFPAVGSTHFDIPHPLPVLAMSGRGEWEVRSVKWDPLILPPLF